MPIGSQPTPACAVVKPPVDAATREWSYCHRARGSVSSRRQGVSADTPFLWRPGGGSDPCLGRIPAGQPHPGAFPPGNLRFWPKNPPFPPGSSGEGGQTGDLTTFLPPCGAKLWGSGGAPPTNLILLRIQCCAAVAEPPALARRPDRRSRPTRPPAAVPRPRPPVAVGESFRPPFHASGVVVALTQSGGVVAPSAGKDLPPSAQAPTAALRFAPSTLAEESWCPLSRPTAP